MSNVDREALMREMAKAWREASAGALWSDALNAVEPAIRATERAEIMNSLMISPNAESAFCLSCWWFKLAVRPISNRKCPRCGAAAIRAREGKS